MLYPYKKFSPEQMAKIIEANLPYFGEEKGIDDDAWIVFYYLYNKYGMGMNKVINKLGAIYGLSADELFSHLDSLGNSD